jgi:hypothetical protein
MIGYAPFTHIPCVSEFNVCTSFSIESPLVGVVGTTDSPDPLRAHEAKTK